MIVIVPNELRDAINEKLNAAIEEHKDAEQDRDLLFSQLLWHFNKYGTIPEFTLIPPVERHLKQVADAVNETATVVVGEAVVVSNRPTSVMVLPPVAQVIVPTTW